MKYVFFGSPEFAATIIKKLINDGNPPTAVVCNPDRPVGRNKVITPSPVKRAIVDLPEDLKNKVKILEPEKLDSGFISELKAIGADFFVVAAYAKIIPKEVLDIPRLGVIGVHPSLLPRYRGASPIQSVLLNGEKETGVTLYLVDEKVDHGAVIGSKSCVIEQSDEYESLMKKLAELSGDFLTETLPIYEQGRIKPKVQDETKATYTKKFTTEDGFIPLSELRDACTNDSSKFTYAIFNKIRALNPEPGVWTLLDGNTEKRVKILEAGIIGKRLLIKKIQVEGKLPVSLKNVIDSYLKLS